MKTKKHLQSIIENLNVIIDEKNSIIDRLLKEKMSATDQYYASLKDQDAIREELFTLRQERLNLNIKSLENGLNQLQTETDHTLRQIKLDISLDAAAASTEHEGISKAVLDLKETLNSFINNQNTENMFNIKKLREKEAEIARLTAEKNELQNAIDRLTKDLNESVANEEALRNRLDQLGYAENQLEQLRETLNTKEAEATELQAKIDGQAAELEEYRHKLSSANGKQGTLTAKIKKLEAQIEQLTNPTPAKDVTDGDSE